MRLELKGGGGSRFWEITVDRLSLTTRWGDIGTAGQSKTVELATVRAARTAYDQQLAEKLKKGYQLAPGQTPVTPTGRVDPSLEQALQQRPDDERGYLVLADALTEAGDPRGELISIQHALAAAPGDAKLAAREKKLLSAFGLPDPKRVKLSWRWGFVQTAHFHNPKDWKNPHADPIALAREVFAMPMSAVIEELQLGMLRWHNQSADVPALLREAARQPWAPRLKRLRIGHVLGMDIDLAHHTVGELSVICRAFPALEALTIRAGEFALEPLALPRLRALTLETCAMSHARLRAVTQATLPALEKLELSFGSKADGADVGVAQLEPLLDGASFRNVKHLGLRNFEQTDTLCEAVLFSKLLQNLEGLDLSMGTMSDTGARALAKNPAAFARLDTLNVTGNFLSAEGLAALSALPCAVVSEPQKERDNPEYGFVTVWE